MTAIAALGHLGIRKEASFASGGAIDSWQPFDSESIQLNRANVYGDRIQASEESVGAVLGHRSVTGSITFGISPQNPSEWWECMLGQSSSPHSGERPLKSLVLQIDRETGAVQASGCMIASATISSSQGEGPDSELKCAANIEGKDLSSVTAGTPSFTSTDPPYIHSEASFLLNDVADTDVQSWSVTIDNNLATDLYGAGYSREDIPATKLTVTGNYTKMYESTTERDAFFAGSARSFQVTFNRGTRSFDINCAKIRYDNRPAPLGGQSEYIIETFNWTAYVDDASSENSIVITTDTT